MKGQPIIYVPIDPEDNVRKRIQRECVEDLLLDGWKNQGTMTLADSTGTKICVRIMQGVE